VLAAVWAAGSALAPRAPASERLAFGVLALVGLAWATMLQGPAGVGLLGRPWALRAIVLVLLAALLAWRRPSLRPGAISWPALATAVVTTAAVTYPALLAATPRLWPSHEDMLWHQGWIRQLAAGTSAPGGVYAGEPNSYPWLYHSVAAWVAGLLPGGLDPALAALDIGGVAAGWLGMWLLARELRCPPRAAGWAASLFILAAGFGWIWQHSAAAVMAPNGVDFGPYRGDLVLYNALLPSLGDIPPLIPRELAVCLSPLALWLGVRGLGRVRERWALWAAGAATGFAFLIGPLAGGFCAVWGIVLAVARRDRGVWRGALAAAAVAAVWLVPLFVSYHRYGGFVSITHLPAIDPSPGQAVVALGILLPLGLAGLEAVWAHPDGIDRTAVAVIAGVPLAAVLAAAAAGQGGELLGTPALVRWSRYLPYVALGLAVPAGVAADRLVAALRRRAPAAGVAAAVALAAVAVPSTVLAAAAVVHHAYPRPLRCSARPPAGALAAVALPEPVADNVAFDLFAQTANSALFLRQTRAKVRYRTWPLRPPTQRQRRAWRAALVGDDTVPSGVTWIVAGPRAAFPGFTRVGTCTLEGEAYPILRRGG